MKKSKIILWGMLAVLLFSMVPIHAATVTEIIPIQKPDCDITIMSYNILHDGADNWQKKNRMPMVLETVRSVDPDVIGFQEVSAAWYEYLTNNLPDYQILKAYQPGVGEGVMIAYKIARFNLLEKDYFYLSETPEVRSKGWDATDYRVLLWAKLYDKQTGKTFVQANTHLYHSLETARFYGSQMVNDYLQGLDLPFFSCGDYNSLQTSSYYANMIRGKVGDTRYMAKDTTDTPTTQSGSIIDYVFADETSVGVVKHRVMTKQYYGMNTSDHRAVVAYCDFAEETLDFSFGKGNYNAEQQTLTDQTREQSYTFTVDSVSYNKVEVYTDAALTEAVDPTVSLQNGLNTFYLKVTSIGGSLSQTVKAEITCALSTDCSLLQIEGAEKLDPNTFLYQADGYSFTLSATVAEGASAALYIDAACTEAAEDTVSVSNTEKVYYVKVTARAGNFKIYELRLRRYDKPIMINDIQGDGIEIHRVEESGQITLGVQSADIDLPLLSLPQGAQFKWFSDAPCSETATEISVTNGYERVYYLRVELQGRTKVYTVYVSVLQDMPQNTRFVYPEVETLPEGDPFMVRGGNRYYLTSSSGPVYSSIAEAVNAAAAGDSIYVMAGSYNETVEITKSVKLYGANCDISPISRGEEWSYNEGRRDETYMYGKLMFPSGLSDWTIDGFYFGGERPDANIQINSNTTPITNVTFARNVFATKINHAYTSPIQGVGNSPKELYIYDNYYKNVGLARAITFRNLKDLVVENNFIEDCASIGYLNSEQNGDQKKGENNVTFIGNRIEECRQSLWLYTSYAHKGFTWRFENNEFYNNSADGALGMSLSSAASAPTDFAASSITLVGNTFDGNGYDLRFDSNGSTALQTDIRRNLFYRSTYHVKFGSAKLSTVDLTDNFFAVSPRISGGNGMYMAQTYWKNEDFTDRAKGEKKEVTANEYYVSPLLSQKEAGTLSNVYLATEYAEVTVGKNGFATVAAAVDAMKANGEKYPILYLGSGVYDENVTIPANVMVRGYYYGVDPVDKQTEKYTDRWSLSSARDSAKEAVISGVLTVSGDITAFVLDGVRLYGNPRILLQESSGADCNVTLQNIVADGIVAGLDGVINIGAFGGTKCYYVTCKNIFIRTVLSPFLRKVVAQQITIDNAFYADSVADFCYTALPVVPQSKKREPVFVRLTNSMFWNTDGILLNCAWSNSHSTAEIAAADAAGRSSATIEIENNVFMDTIRVGNKTYVIRPQIDSDNVFVKMKNNTVWQWQYSSGLFFWPHSWTGKIDLSDQILCTQNRFIGDKTLGVLRGVGSASIDYSGNFFSDDAGKPMDGASRLGSLAFSKWHYLNEEMTRCSACDNLNGRVSEKRATCKESGYKKVYCVGCGALTEEIFYPVSQTHTEDTKNVVVDKAPTCAKAGEGHTNCIVCGCKVKTVSLPATGLHTAGGWERKQYPTFTAAGVMVQKCTVCAKEMQSYREEKLTAFTDVKAGSWYYSAVEVTVGRGLFAGVGGGKFAPNENATRGQVVAVLSRLAGVDLSAYTQTIFSDVSPKAYYAKAVNWAYAKGIVAGIGNGKFGPDQNVTREQFAVFLMRYAKNLGYTMPIKEAAISFADAAKISSFAKEAVTACVRADIINGSIKGGKTYFNPKGNATRAELSMMIYKFLINVIEV